MAIEIHSIISYTINEKKNLVQFKLHVQYIHVLSSLHSFFYLRYPDAVQTSCSADTCALKIMCWFHVLFLVQKQITIWTEKNQSCYNFDDT